MSHYIKKIANGDVTISSADFDHLVQAENQLTNLQDALARLAPIRSAGTHTVEAKATDRDLGSEKGEPLGTVFQRGQTIDIYTTRDKRYVLGVVRHPQPRLAVKQRVHALDYDKMGSAMDGQQVTVWSHDERGTKLWKVPDGYTGTLLYPYVDDVEVEISLFSDYLFAIGTTLQQVQDAITAEARYRGPR